MTGALPRPVRPRVSAAAQANINAAVVKIKNNTDIANQVVSILGALDKVLGIAVKLLA